MSWGFWVVVVIVIYALYASIPMCWRAIRIHKARKLYKSTGYCKHEFVRIEHTQTVLSLPIEICKVCGIDMYDFRKYGGLGGFR